jgi:hypothetical protein
MRLTWAPTSRIATPIEMTIIIFNKLLFVLSDLRVFFAASVLVLCGCSSQNGSAGGDAGTSSAATITETEVSLTLTLQVLSGEDGGAPSDAGASDAGPPPAATLIIVAHDGTTPVITDLWLYTLDGSGTQTPLTAFTATPARKSPRLMLPATIAGKPSGLSPADDGRMNGLVTGNTRGVLDAGTFVPTFTGTVVVSLPTPPTTPILVVAGVEDQRYGGAAVINPDGTPGTVPSGALVLETHTARSFTQDVAPLLQAQCSACHNPKGPDNAGFYLVTGSRDDLVNDNFALKEQTLDCQQEDTDGGAALAACIQAITKAQFLVEPGAPAVSDLLQRARPDEDAGTSTLGLAWYGGKGKRYSSTYGDRRMPSTTTSADAGTWTNQSTYFDFEPADYQTVYDWVAQGAQP